MKNKYSKAGITALVILVAASAVIAIKYRGSPSVKPPADNAFVPSKSDFVAPERVLLNVPFTSQAPTGNWSDPRQEDGCEEASVLMAWLWLKNQAISKAEAEKTIIAMADFEQEHYGNYHDTGAADTAKFMKDYYDYDKFFISLNPSIADIKKQLSEGNVVLAPANGQKLGNPNYKQPGPLTHMLVIKGYDDSRGQFITNDPGTRNGEGYVYKYETLFNAMVDYPTGLTHGSQEGRPRSMIVIQK